MKKTSLLSHSSLFLLSLLCLFGGSLHSASAQNNGVPLEEFVSKADKDRLDKQAVDLYKKFDKVTNSYGKSVVYVCRNNRVVALGTVVAQGKVLTKWEDLAATRGALVIYYEGRIYDTRAAGGDAKHDLVLLEAPSLQAPALDFSKTAKPDEGDFLITVMPDGKAGDFGVVSVDARSLREIDLPYIGIVADIRYGEKSGTKVEALDPRAGAQKAGIKAGDVILKIDDLSLAGPMAIRTALKNKRPGDTVKATVQRDNKKFDVEITLSSRPRSPQFSEQRIEAMNKVGNPMNPRRKDFPYVIQSDMTLLPSHAGAPVVSLDGKVVGLALSRAGRIETYILPASLIVESIQNGGLPGASVEVVENGSNEAATLARHKEDEEKDTEYTKQLRAMQHEIQQVEVLDEDE